MATAPLISIALATCDGAAYLREQLESIYAQTYSNIEVVATDDLSGDETFRILEEYRATHGLRCYRNSQRLGLVKNFQRAIELATGDFIALCDQDDVWEPDKLATLAAGIGSASLVHSDAVLVDKADRIINGSFSESSKKRIDLEPWEYLIPNNNNVTGCTALFRSDLKEMLLPIPEEFGFHDHWIALMAARMGGVAYTPEKLVRYRQHGGNTLGASPARKGTVRRKRLESRLLFYRCLQENSRRLRLSDSEQGMVDDLAAFFASRLNDRIAWRAFTIGLRRFSMIKPKASPLERFWQAPSFLIGMGGRPENTDGSRGF